MDNGSSAGVFIFLIIYLAVIVFLIAGMWKAFAKAGQPGWACIVPFYNVIVMVIIAGKPAWWFLLLFVPIVNFVFAIIVALDTAKNFGKGAGFGIAAWVTSVNTPLPSFVNSWS